MQEYKTKICYVNGSIFKEKPFYYDSKLPIKTLEISTYYDFEKNKIEFINYLRKIKLEDFHLILYIIPYRERIYYDRNDKILLKELEKSVKSKPLKIMFVITRSYELDEYDKAKIIHFIFLKFGDSIFREYLSDDNIVFVDFNKNAKYGKEHLLEKIYNYFGKSKENINTNNKLDLTIMKNNALILEKNNKLINDLKQSLDEKIKEIEVLKDQIRQLEEQIKKLENLNHLQKPLEKKINKFEKINNLENNFIESKLSFELLSNEKKISIIFTSMDENNIYSLICKTTDIFYDIEKKFYKEYMEYKKLVQFFMANGKIIKRDKSLEENGIHNNDIIYLY